MDWNIIKSRTIQILTLLLILNAVPDIRNLFPANILSIIDAILIALAGYFRISARVPLGKFKSIDK